MSDEDADPQGKRSKRSQASLPVISLLLLATLLLVLLSYVNSVSAPREQIRAGKLVSKNALAPIAQLESYADGQNLRGNSLSSVAGGYGWRRQVARKLEVNDPPCDWSLDKYVPGALQNYPQHFPILDVLSNWSPDDPDEPAFVFDSLCRFNFSDPMDYQRAQFFRENERPFIVIDVPNIEGVRKSWTWEHLEASMKRDQTVEISHDNHLMFWRLDKTSRKSKVVREGWEAPTKKVLWPFREWKEKADKADATHLGPNEPHHYLIANRAPWAERDLTIFKPKPSFFIVEAEKNKGVHCRFGMRGVIAEAHYDGGRNMVAMIKGAKRYILASPLECKNMLLYPRGHPSSRHTKVNFGNVEDSYLDEFHHAKALEVILKAGEVLYIPSYWFHHIISLGTSLQCNSRSGYRWSREGGF